MAQMGRPEMVAALGEVADILGARRQTARIYIVGGAAIAMAYDSDRFTHDIDAVVLDGHSAVVSAVHEVARRHGWHTSWLNEQASAYIPRGDDYRGRVVFDHPSLRVTAASLETMLAMKIMSARLTDDPDLRLLVGILGYTTPDQVRDTVASVFPGERLSERSEAAITRLFGEQ